MRQRLLASSIFMALCANFAAGTALAQSNDSASADGKKKEATELQGVVVTGSLIPQAQIETASPVITITSTQIQKQGFGSVYDALRALPIATGTVQDNQNAGGFTQGAQSLSLLGLDPGFTLNLIDGHPLADYPLQFNGQSNFVDLSSIPMAMVDHIDILPGNQSAIYGSSAIAGVINIILKKNVDGVSLNYRVGGYDRGGGGNQRLQIVGGNTFSNGLSLTYGLQLSNQEPIWGYQRPEWFNTTSNPNPANRYGSRTFLYNYLDSSFHTKYVDPGAAACTPLASDFGNSTSYQYRPNRGFYCGSTKEPGYQTLLAQRRAASAYVHGTYRFNDSMEAYGTILFNVSSQRYSDGNRFWQTNNDLGTGGYFVNNDTGRLEQVQLIFSPEETGGPNATNIRELQRSYNSYFGLRGNIGGSKWDYDVYFDRSGNFDNSKEYWPIASKVDAFFEKQFLGPKLGTASGYPIYSPNTANIYKQLTPAEYMSFQGLIQSKSKAWTQHLNLQITNTDLFSLPAGSVAAAGLLQVGNQSWTNPIDPLLSTPGGYWGRTDSSGAGTRDLYAVGGELQVPILSMLTADLSARYDKYSNHTTGGDDKITYKLGLEFRPTDAFLFRGSYATAFRAPDMAYTFGGASGFYQTVTDYYRCAVVEPGKPISQCDYNSQTIFGQHTGNAALTSVTAKSGGLGAVWSPNSSFNVKVDYYDIKIKNEVQLQDINFLLREEADCRINHLSTPTCDAVLAQIQRNSATAAVPYQLNQVTIYPINIASERVRGIVSSLNYKLEAGKYGDFTFSASYNVSLHHTQIQRPGDPIQDLLRNPYVSQEYKTIGNASVSWDIGSWSATLFGIRYGKAPNNAAFSTADGYAAAGAGTLPPWILYNGSVTYNFDDNAAMSFTVNNIQNSGPPKDATNNVSAPFYNIFNTNPYGRAYWLELNVKFGGSKKG